MQSWPAVVIAIVLGAGCTDGVGTPIRLPLPLGDAAARGDGGDDEHEHLDAEHCVDALDWPADYEADEQALLDSINGLRRDGYRCGDRELDAVDALELSPSLRCAARLHSLDMVERGFFGRTNPDGDEPHDRMRNAGYDVGDSNEVRATGESDAMSALQHLLEDWDECNSLGSRRMTHVGIGRYEDRWTLDFATPDDDDGSDERP
jgi:uncharacterized protein YkwD